MSLVHERSRIIRMSGDRWCITCGRPIRRGVEGWYAGSREAGYRCTGCGRHTPAGGAQGAPRRPASRRGIPTPTEATGSSLAAISRLLDDAGGTIARSSAPGPLTERYRPRTLGAIRGQDRAVRILKRFAASPFPCAFLLEGETGTGKSSAALGLAEALGCDIDVDPPEFGGIHTIASGEQTAETVRQLHTRIWQAPLYGSGWKVVVVNEADRMSAPAETIWLDRLEALPPRTALVFTTNQANKLTPRLRDRCTRIEFIADADRLRADAIVLLAAIWRQETGNGSELKAAVIQRIIDGSIEEGTLSFRRAVKRLEAELLTRD